jgi:hypothetical protein
MIDVPSIVLAHNRNLKAEIDEWLQAENGPFYEWKNTWMTADAFSNASGREYKTKEEAIAICQNHMNVAIIKNIETYRGKDWAFEYDCTYCVMVDTGVDLSITPSITFTTSNDSLAVEFKIKFL